MGSVVAYPRARLSATTHHMVHGRHGCLFVLTILAALLQTSRSQAQPQGSTQFIPDELGKLVPARLVFRAQGLVDAWRDPSARKAVIRDRIVLDPAYWRQAFAATGGVAAMGPDLPSLDNFTITTAEEDVGIPDGQHQPELNFSQMSNAMLVGKDGLLTFSNIIVSDIAQAGSYTYSPAQPYRSIGIGTGTWPTIALAPNATLVMTNVTLVYRNPSPIDTCEQYHQRVTFGLQQVYGQANIRLVNGTTGLVTGPLAIPVMVLNGSTNATLGNATATFTNVTFTCVAPPDPQQGLSPAARAAAVAVPVAVGGALLTAMAVWVCVRRHRRASLNRTSAAAAVNKDVEAAEQRDNTSSRDQFPAGEDDRDRVVPLTAFPGSPGPSSSTQSRSSSAYGSFMGGSGSYPGSAASAATSSSSTAPPMPFAAGSAAAVAAAAAAAAGQAGSDGITRSSGAMAPASPQMLAPLAAYFPRHQTDAAAGTAASAAAGELGQQASLASSSWQVISDRQTSEETGQGSSGQDAHTISPGSVPVPTMATGSSASGGGTGSGGGRASGGGNGGISGEAAASGSPGDIAARSVAALSRYGGMPALLKARSDMAVLRDLKIGPLLGRGSYGRVYKGRWKAVTVAVKIIEHHEGSPGTARSGGKKISIGRESLLATSMSHPNVVQTYHISTMTVSQRNALASSWLKESGDASGSESSSSKRRHRCKQQQQPTSGPDDDSGGSSSSGEQEVKDVLETWMLMEYCEKGSLDRAVQRGKFVRREDRQPEMIGIYKALLDTASGLDYLHSIGVVHGDLKTANVLLKGSTRDVRGFACKITDFGLSRVLDMDATHVSTRTYGTIVYMLSELLLTGRMTTATDIYSFGLMMWELFCSQRVFEEGLSIGQIFYMIAYQGWRPAVPPNCPPGYAQLMTACWHQDPEQRPTVQQVLRSLQSLYVAEKQRIASAREAAAASAQAGAQDRTSFESIASDRYKNAAAAASEAAAEVGRAEGEAAASAKAAESPSFVTPVMPAASTSQGPGASSRAATEAAAAAAAALAQTLPPARAAGESLRFSIETYVPPVVSEGSGSGAGQDSGCNAQGSGENEGQEEYQPWAHAVVSQRGSGSIRVGSDFASGRLRQLSFTSGTAAASSAAVELEGGAGQQQQQRQQQGRRGVDEIDQRQMEQQQRLQQWHQQQQQAAFAPQTAAAAGVQDHSRQWFGTSEIEPLYNEPLPSESLFQNLSSCSNVVNNADDGYGYDEAGGPTSGYLKTVHRAATQGRLQQQLQQRAALLPGGAAAAQGFVEAIEMAAQRGSTSSRQHPATSCQPYYSQQQQQQAQAVHPTTSSLAGWGSVSTSTLPSVLAGSSIYGSSSMALFPAGSSTDTSSAAARNYSNSQQSGSLSSADAAGRINSITLASARTVPTHPITGGLSSSTRSTGPAAAAAAAAAAANMFAQQAAAVAERGGVTGANQQQQSMPNSGAAAAVAALPDAAVGVNPHQQALSEPSGWFALPGPMNLVMNSIGESTGNGPRGVITRPATVQQAPQAVTGAALRPPEPSTEHGTGQLPDTGVVSRSSSGSSNSSGRHYSRRDMGLFKLMGGGGRQPPSPQQSASLAGPAGSSASAMLPSSTLPAAAAGGTSTAARPASSFMTPTGGTGSAAQGVSAAYPFLSTGMLSTLQEHQTLMSLASGQAMQPHQQQHQQQEQQQQQQAQGSAAAPEVAGGPPPSPFAALAQRAGSLFGPV